MSLKEEIKSLFETFPRLTKRTSFKANEINRSKYSLTLDFLRSDRTNYHFDELSKAVKVSERVLWNWHEELHKPDGSDFHPRDVDKINLRNQKLSNALEDVMMNYIIENYITPGYYFDNHICRSVCFCIWQIKATGKDREKDFKASRKWASLFMDRHGYSLKKELLKRRPGGS